MIFAEKITIVRETAKVRAQRTEQRSHRRPAFCHPENHAAHRLFSFRSQMNLPTNPSYHSMRMKLNFALRPAINRTGQPGGTSMDVDTENFLQTELRRQPEIRSEVVNRARALAQDPNYHSMEILWQVAGMILASPDLSEDGS